MKTNIYHLESNNTSIIADALNEIEQAANYNLLSKKTNTSTKTSWRRNNWN